MNSSCIFCKNVTTQNSVNGNLKTTNVRKSSLTYCTRNNILNLEARIDERTFDCLVQPNISRAVSIEDFLLQQKPEYSNTIIVS
jgi:hypothetical protein